MDDERINFKRLLEDLPYARAVFKRLQAKYGEEE
tara:strand:+ start:43 stop:144 length:102 start_codon:yes stop_codon:yes gene_type:complete